MLAVGKSMNSTATKERGIICTAEEVRGFRDRSRTQLRRVIKFPSSGGWEPAKRPEQWGEQDDDWTFIDMADPIGTYPTSVRCPFGVPGDRLRVEGTDLTLELTDVRAQRDADLCEWALTLKVVDDPNLLQDKTL